MLMAFTMRPFIVTAEIGI